MTNKKYYYTVDGVFEGDSLLSTEEIVDLLNWGDELLDLNYDYLKNITKLNDMITELKEEHSETKFKLDTLEKYHTKSCVAFNCREMSYLNKLKDKG